MPWLPPDQGSPDRGSVSVPMCWPMPAWAGLACAGRHPTGNLNRSRPALPPGAARYQCSLRRRRGLITRLVPPPASTAAPIWFASITAARLPTSWPGGLVVPPTEGWPGPAHRAAGTRHHPGCQDQRSCSITCACTWPRPTLDSLAEHCMMSRRTFSRRFQLATGLSLGSG